MFYILFGILYYISYILYAFQIISPYILRIFYVYLFFLEIMLSCAFLHYIQYFILYYFLLYYYIIFFRVYVFLSHSCNILYSFHIIFSNFDFREISY